MPKAFLLYNTEGIKNQVCDNICENNMMNLSTFVLYGKYEVVTHYNFHISRAQEQQLWYMKPSSMDIGLYCKTATLQAAGCRN